MMKTFDETTIVERAFEAYFEKRGEMAPQPSNTSGLVRQGEHWYVELHNGGANQLAAYRIEGDDLVELTDREYEKFEAIY